MVLAVGYPIPYQTSGNPHEKADENQAFRYTEQALLKASQIQIHISPLFSFQDQ